MHTHTHPHTHLRSSLMAYHPLEVSFDFMSPYFSSTLSLLCAGPCSKHFVLINTYNLFQIPMKYILLLPHFMIRSWDSGKIIKLPGVMWMISEGIYQISNPRSLIQNWVLDLMLYCLQFISELLVLKTELHLISPFLPLVLQMQFSFSSSPWTTK